MQNDKTTYKSCFGSLCIAEKRHNNAFRGFGFPAIGAGLGVWGVINLLEGYGNDNPGAKSQGIKQLMAGGGVILIGTQLVPQLSGLFG